MIKVLEQDLLDDKFIIKGLTSNIKLNDKLSFTKEDIYYFGNYTKEGLDIIRKKLLKNKKTIKNAIEKGIKIIISGNSVEIFNNNFNTNDINLFTSYNDDLFKYKRKGIRFNNINKKSRIKNILDLKKPVNTGSFRYKNMICTENIQELMY